MNLFSLFNKLFRAADEGSLKRRANDSSSRDEDFVLLPKRHCRDLEQPSYESQTAAVTTCYFHDSVEISNEVRGNKLSNGRDVDQLWISEPVITPRSMKSVKKIRARQRVPCQNTSRYYVDKKNISMEITNMDSKSSTLSESHRLREREKYNETLQSFRQPRIQILKSKANQAQVPRPSIEVVTLDEHKSSTNKPAAAGVASAFSSLFNMNWFQNKCKEKHTLMNVTEDTKDKSCSTSCTKNTSVSISEPSSSEDTRANWRRSITSNTLRDSHATNSVTKSGFIPQVTQRYDARFLERLKEAEELKKKTRMLAAQNRFAREAALAQRLARSMSLCEVVLDEVEEPEDEPLPVLSAEMLQQVKNALIPHPHNQVLVQGFGLSITRKDIHTLSGLNWLNDEVINFYMNLIIVRSSNGNLPKVHVMNTFFYPKLLSGGHSSLKRWTRKVDIFSKDLLVVPIHLGMHWCMSIIDFREKTIRYFDSMGGSNQKCLNVLKQYLQDESLDKKKQPYDVSDWKLICDKDIPQQTNCSDCGVFSCMFAEYITANKRITFSQQDMPYFRNKMVYEILNSKLL